MHILLIPVMGTAKVENKLWLRSLDKPQPVDSEHIIFLMGNTKDLACAVDRDVKHNMLDTHQVRLFHNISAASSLEKWRIMSKVNDGWWYLGSASIITTPSSSILPTV